MTHQLLNKLHYYEGLVFTSGPSTSTSISTRACPYFTMNTGLMQAQAEAQGSKYFFFPCACVYACVTRENGTYHKHNIKLETVHFIFKRNSNYSSIQPVGKRKEFLFFVGHFSYKCTEPGLTIDQIFVY